MFLCHKKSSRILIVWSEKKEWNCLALGELADAEVPIFLVIWVPAVYVSSLLSRRSTLTEWSRWTLPTQHTLRGTSGGFAAVTGSLWTVGHRAPPRLDQPAKVWHSHIHYWDTQVRWRHCRTRCKANHLQRQSKVILVTECTVHHVHALSSAIPNRLSGSNLLRCCTFRLYLFESILRKERRGSYPENRKAAGAIVCNSAYNLIAH